MSTSFSETICIQEEYTQISWHKEFPLLAASSPTQVHFYDNQGKRISKAIIKNTGAAPTCIEWHPIKKMLASTWSNGALCIWNEIEMNVRETINHSTSINTISWSATGHRVVSSDTVLIYLYRLDLLLYGNATQEGS